ncbi:DUF4861 domain-containing protein [Flavihumibacter sp. UBA7668]|uniref:DUF4861 domain-containing protein n=1 Tax=Flavihumibacter sp. UBA7668 TaxID=1946542 RepID=UPI0025C576E0|nr:DUF4861 domain-containing protein [Flavihumibacter sp. UBA7668]
MLITNNLCRSFSVLLCILGMNACKPGSVVLSFYLENPSDQPRNAALVLLTRAAIQDKSKEKISPYYKVLLNDKVVDCQFDDIDKDGQWDELVFLQDFKAGEKITIHLEGIEKPDTINVTPRAHVRHKRKLDGPEFGPSLERDSIDGTQKATDFTKQKLPPFLTEGPAWENDQLGFRLYYDVRNGKDIWGKLIPDMVLDKVGTDTAKSYHNLDSWGMDLLKVGSSLGAGALALYIPDLDGKDSLVRVGGSNIGKTVYEQVADGPVRAIFRMHYNDWKLHPSVSPVSITEVIQIWGGQLFYESSVIVKQLPKQAQLVTGIVNLHDAEKKELKQGTARAVYTHHIQSENKDALGMAIVLSENELSGFTTSKNTDTDIKNTYLVKMKTSENQAVRFRFYAAWEKSHPANAKAIGFEEFLNKELQQFQQPLIIR